MQPKHTYTHICKHKTKSLLFFFSTGKKERISAAIHSSDSIGVCLYDFVSISIKNKAHSAKEQRPLKEWSAEKYKTQIN